MNSPKIGTFVASFVVLSVVIVLVVVVVFMLERSVWTTTSLHIYSLTLLKSKPQNEKNYFEPVAKK